MKIILKGAFYLLREFLNRSHVVLEGKIRIKMYCFGNYSDISLQVFISDAPRFPAYRVKPADVSESMFALQRGETTFISPFLFFGCAVLYQ